MTSIKPLKNTVLFEFIDDITNGAFASKTKSGIILTNKNHQDNSNLPRWGKVFEIGPDVTEIAVGDYILIAPLRWTLGFKFNDKQLSKTIEPEILATAPANTDVATLYI